MDDKIILSGKYCESGETVDQHPGQVSIIIFRQNAKESPEGLDKFYA